MCGLFGIIGPGINNEDLNVLDNLARASVVRGKGGAGICQGFAYPNSKWNPFYTVEKTGNEISYLLWYHRTAKGGDRTLFNSLSDNFYLGHVREPTRGDINQKNAHPFDLETIVGMHNGTLKECDYNPPPEMTDSELMFRDIEKKGLKEVLSGLHKDSAFAIVLFDKKEKTISIVRNKWRSLSLAWNSNRKVLYYASEGMMLEWILTRNGIKYDKILSVSENLIHTFRPGDVNAGRKPNWELTPLFAPKVEVKSNIVDISVGAYPEKKVEPPVPLIGGPKGEPPGPNLVQKAETKVREEVKTTGKEVLKRKSLHTFCASCYKEMDLVDKYQGNEIRDGVYLCAGCDDDSLVVNGKGRIVKGNRLLF